MSLLRKVTFIEYQSIAAAADDQNTKGIEKDETGRMVAAVIRLQADQTHAALARFFSLSPSPGSSSFNSSQQRHR